MPISFRNNPRASHAFFAEHEEELPVGFISDERLAELRDCLKVGIQHYRDTGDQNSKENCVWALDTLETLWADGDYLALRKELPSIKRMCARIERLSARQNPDLSSARSARREQILDKRVMFQGRPTTVRQYLEHLAAEGGTLVTHEVPRIKDMSRAAFFRATGEQQRAHARRQQEAGMKTEYVVRLPDGAEFSLNRTEADFFAELSDHYGAVREEAEISEMHGAPGTSEREQYDRDMDHLFGRRR